MPAKDVHIQAHHARLKRWPGNIRQTYRPDDVAAMAESQRERAAQGKPACIHAIVVTPGPGLSYNPRLHKDLYLVAGHLRHAGNAALGRKAPPLNCIVRYYATEADLLADMRTENGQRSDPSPLEWARHFRAELDRGLPLHALLKQSRKSKGFAEACLALLDLAAEAQRIIDAGDLPLGAAAHLAELDDKPAQAKIASRLRGGTVAQVSRAVTLELQRRVKQHRVLGLLRPRRPATDNLPKSVPLAAASIRPAAAHQCALCDIGRTLALPEPAWHIALNAAGEVCDDCNLKDIKNACNGCPLAEMMARLARRHGAAQPARAVTAA